MERKNRKHTADNLASKRVIDLTFSMDEERLRYEEVFKWIPSLTFTPTATHETLGRSVHRVVMATHSGTHIDAPFHFIEHGITIDEVPFSQLIGEAILLDLTSKGAGETITAHDLERVGPDVRTGDIVLLHTGWDRLWGTNDYFWHSPYLTVDAAEWLVERKIATLGLDLPFPDNIADFKPKVGPPIHMLLLGNNIIIIEMMCNLGAVDRRRFTFIALPLKFKGMDASPTRAVALLP